MRTNMYLMFPGTCREAFAFYEKTFGTKILMTMTYGEAPGNPPFSEAEKSLIMHTALPVGNIVLMGSDAPERQREALGGFSIALDTPDESEVRRLYDALSEGGTVSMPLQKTFWSPLFGMCKDRFGVGWMVSIATEPPTA